MKNLEFKVIRWTLVFEERKIKGMKVKWTFEFRTPQSDPRLSPKSFGSVV